MRPQSLDRYSCYNSRLDEREFEDQTDPCEPEKELLRYVLIRAIQDATGNINIGGDRPGTVEETALDWFFSKVIESETHFTFIWVCDSLGLNPDPIRETINNARENGLKLSIFDHHLHSCPVGERFHQSGCTTRFS